MWQGFVVWGQESLEHELPEDVEGYSSVFSRKCVPATPILRTFVGTIKDTLENAAFVIFGRPRKGGLRVQMGNPYLLCLILSVFCGQY